MRRQSNGTFDFNDSIFEPPIDVFTSTHLQDPIYEANEHKLSEIDIKFPLDLGCCCLDMQISMITITQLLESECDSVLRKEIKIITPLEV